MLTCIICRFETELDDAITHSPRGRCVCLRCFNRETGDDRRMSNALRRDLIATLAGIGAA